MEAQHARTAAVEIVDGIHEFTYEFAPLPAAHAQLYEIAEELITQAIVLSAPDTAAESDRLKASNKKLLTALELISQIQRDKCETASAEILFVLLDNKVCIAIAAIEELQKASQQDVE